MARPCEFDESTAVRQAMEAFWSGSFLATSTQDLCRATGLSRSSLYNTFSSKSELFSRTLEEYGSLKSVERATYLEGEGDGRARLERLLLDVVSGQFATAERRSCLVVNAAVELGESDERVAGLVRRNLSEFGALLAELIRGGQADGSIANPAPAADLAAVVHAAINGVQVAGRVEPDTSAASATVRTLMTLL